MMPNSPLGTAALSPRGAVGDAIDWLDSYGFQVGSTYFSLWSAVAVVGVVLGVVVFARLGGKLAHWLLGKFAGLDETQKLALGFGLQKTFGNLLAGIILLMDRSIKPGDVISVADAAGNDSFGQIRKIGIRAISVVTRDKTEYLIPNENLMINQVVNWSYSSRDVRVKAPVGVAYHSDLDLAERLMMQAVRDTPRVLTTPAASVRLMGFGERAVEFEIRFWIMDPEQGINGVRSEVLKRVWKLFHENGISLPFPRRDIALENEQFNRLIAALSQREKDGT
jgi:small-conductance mechanosensitive channel